MARDGQDVRDKEARARRFPPFEAPVAYQEYHRDENTVAISRPWELEHHAMQGSSRDLYLPRHVPGYSQVSGLAEGSRHHVQDYRRLELNSDPTRHGPSPIYHQTIRESLSPARLISPQYENDQHQSLAAGPARSNQNYPGDPHQRGDLNRYAPYPTQSVSQAQQRAIDPSGFATRPPRHLTTTSWPDPSNPYPLPVRHGLSAELELAKRYPEHSRRYFPARSMGRGASLAQCASCGTGQTPEWRKGPLGPRTLCNACGLIWAKLNRRKLEAPPLQSSKDAPFTSNEEHEGLGSHIPEEARLQHRIPDGLHSYGTNDSLHLQPIRQTAGGRLESSNQERITRPSYLNSPRTYSAPSVVPLLGRSHYSEATVGSAEGTRSSPPLADSTTPPITGRSSSKLSIVNLIDGPSEAMQSRRFSG